MKPFGIVSDTHCHGWTAFSVVNPDGVNNRLRIILDEIKRCAAKIKELGGDTMYHGGDLFHVRGSIAPSTLNPTMDCFREIVDSGIKVILLAGNHDLEKRESERISSAITALEGVGCTVINKPSYTFGDGSGEYLVPWIQNVTELKAVIEDCPPENRSDTTLILHAPIDGVIAGLPDHGLSGEWLAELGFKRVFSGHYHHFKEVSPGKVWSIGANTQQTWSDVNADAGFLIVSDSGVERFAAYSPSFVELDSKTDHDELPLLVDGNYVRVRINSTKTSDIDELKNYLLSCGAKGVVVIPVADVTIPTRAGGSVSVASSATLEGSIGDFIASQTYDNKSALTILCQEILTTVRSVA